MTQRPWRAAIASGLCGILLLQMLVPFTVLAGAIPVLVALRVGPRVAAAVATAGALAALAVILSVAAPSLWVLVGVVTLFFCPLLLGLLLKRTASLTLCFQVAVLGAAFALVAVHAALSDAAAVWVEPLRALLESMEAAGLKLAEDREALIAVWARTMWGALAAIALSIVSGALLLGRWWASLLEAPGQFGAEYRALRLGNVLGAAVTALFLAALFVDSALLGSLAWVAFVALAFQGLSAAHRGKAGGRLNRGWLAAIYVLLFVPLTTSLTVFALAIWGFADNWLRPGPARV